MSLLSDYIEELKNSSFYERRESTESPEAAAEKLAGFEKFLDRHKVKYSTTAFTDPYPEYDTVLYKYAVHSLGESEANVVNIGSLNGWVHNYRQGYYSDEWSSLVSPQDADRKARPYIRVLRKARVGHSVEPMIEYDGFERPHYVTRVSATKRD